MTSTFKNSIGRSITFPMTRTHFPNAGEFLNRGAWRGWEINTFRSNYSRQPFVSSLRINSSVRKPTPENPPMAMVKDIWGSFSISTGTHPGIV